MIPTNEREDLIRETLVIEQRILQMTERGHWNPILEDMVRLIQIIKLLSQKETLFCDCGQQAVISYNGHHFCYDHSPLNPIYHEWRAKPERG